MVSYRFQHSCARDDGEYQEIPYAKSRDISRLLHIPPDDPIAIS